MSYQIDDSGKIRWSRDSRERQSRGSKYRRELQAKKTPSELHVEALLGELNIRFQDQKVMFAGDMLLLADIYLPKPYKLVIEIDGEYHNTQKQQWRDKYKDEYYRSRGFGVMRITNQKALKLDALGLLSLIKGVYV